LETPLYKQEIGPAALTYSALEEKKLEELSLTVNDTVTITQDRTGIVRYIGEAHFFWGTIVGIELLKNSKGKNSGHIDGVKYFECKASKGLFIKPMAILTAEKPKQKSKTRTPQKDPRGKAPEGRRRSEMARGKTNLFQIVKKEEEKPIARDWPAKFKQKAEQERMDRMGVNVGDCVQLSKGERAVILYIGETNNSNGYLMFGVELLDGALGSCSGELNGERYFECVEKRGEFIASDRIRKKVEFLVDLPEW